MADAAGRAGRRSERPIHVAQVLLVAAALALWAASRLPWVVLHSFDGLGQPKTTTLPGATWSTALVPMALVLLAVVVAALAVRGWALRTLAVLVAAVSAGAGYLAISLWVVPDVAIRGADLAQLPVVFLVGSERQHWGAVITLAAAVCTLLGAVLLMRGAVRGPALAGRYAAPAERRAAAIDSSGGQDSQGTSQRTMWDTLDAGGDPTDRASSGGDTPGR